MNVVITGASRGMGKAMAEEFAAHHHNLYLTSKSDINIYKALEELQLKYPDIIIKAKPADLSIKKEALGFADWVLEQTEPDVLINNAGNFISGSVHSEEEGVLEDMINTNLYSAYHITRTLLPSMMKKKKGFIFNICSTASLRAYANGGSYGISKFALLGFNKNLREEMMPHGVKVTAIIAGAIYTDSWAGAGIDRKRFAEPEDVAKMVYIVTQLSEKAVVDEIIVRPQTGDI